MLDLFHLNNYKIDTELLGNHLHGEVVNIFEREFCEYVGAKYGCSLNSATNAIFLALQESKNKVITIPSNLPPVVANSIYNSGNFIEFKDTPDWVGDSYVLHSFKDYKIIDSAQKVSKDQFKVEAQDNDLMIFSFYPTKPVGGLDGGMIVSNDKHKIEQFKRDVMNGMSFSPNNWERKWTSYGWKMYMSSSQAFVALQNLRCLDSKKEKLKKVRNYYNLCFELGNTSDHLYRINIPNRDSKLQEMKNINITCGIHYQPLHLIGPTLNSQLLPKTEYDSSTTLSIPFHENLTLEDLNKITSCILKK